MLLFIISVILFIIVQNKNKKIKELQKQRINFCPKCGCNLQSIGETNDTVNLNQNIELDSFTDKKIDYANKKNTSNPKELKNSVLLIVGSIFIVLAAIIFLTSSWYLIGDSLKSSIIFILIFVFFGFSYIADKKYDLPNTALAFRFISLSYLPIALICPSFFKLFNGALSLPNTLGHIYLFIVCIICSIVYYFESNNKYNKVLYASILSQLLGIICLTTIITKSLTIILIFLFAYILILSVLYDFEYIKNNRKLIRNSISAIFVTLLIVQIGNLALSIARNIEYQENFLLLIIILIIGLYILVRIFKTEKLSYYYTPLILLIMYYLGKSIDSSIVIGELLIIWGLSISCMIDYILHKKIQIFTFIFSLMSLIILYLLGISTGIEYHFISLILLSFIIINYFFGETNKANNTLLVFGLFQALGSFVAKEYLSSSHILILCSAISAYGYYKEDKQFNVFINIPSVLFICANLFIKFNFINIIINLIYLFIVGTIIHKRNTKYKYYGYLSLCTFLIGVFKLIDIQYIALSISTIIFIILEILFDKLKDKNSMLFMLGSYIISCLLLITNNSIISFLCSCLLTICIVGYVFNNESKATTYLLPIICITPSLFFNSSINESLRFIISTLLIVFFSYYFYKNEKFKQFKIVPYIYLLLQSSFEVNIYYYLIMLILIGFASYYYDKNKKSLIILLISLLPLYYNVLYDLNLTYSILTFGIINIYIIYIYKYILHSDKDNSHILLAIVNFISLFTYNNELDGITYVLLIVLLVIYSNKENYTNIFKVLLVSVIINILLLTQEFWLSLPWWLYILGIGIIFVSFAIKSEKNKK